MTSTSLIRNIAKVAGILALGLGIIFWNGSSDSLVPVHIALGAILVISIMILAYQANKVGFSKGIVILAVVWGLSLSVFGLIQGSILVDNQSLVRIIHLMGGVGAIAMSEILAVETKKIKAK
jgi:hypothetical protein